MTLVEIRNGEKAEVMEIDGGALKRRLLELGITSGTRLEVIRRAPFGDPMEIRVRGYLLAVGGACAEKIEVRALK